MKQQHDYPMSIAQAAAALSLAPATIRYYERTGRVEPIRFGPKRQRLYLREHLDAIRAARAKRQRRAGLDKR